MTQEQIVKGNRVIADSPFISDSHKKTIEVLSRTGEENLFYEGAKFHSSWEWIMPVVEAIEALKEVDAHVSINHTCCDIYTFLKGSSQVDTLISERADTKILAVFTAVVAFIEWYNLNRKG